MKIMKELENIDLTKAGEYVLLDWDDLSPDERRILRNAGYEPDNETDPYISIFVSEMENLGIYPRTIESLWDNYEAKHIYAKVLKDAPAYLVFAYGCRWNGTDGYKIAKDKKDSFARDYDTSIYPIAVSRRKKTLICSESSHDVPLGSETVIIALTEKEKQIIERAGWKAILTFVEKCKANVAI